MTSVVVRSSLSPAVIAYEFRARNCELLGISVDSQFVHKAWVETKHEDGGLGGDLEYPLLADLNKKVAQDYGILLDAAGVDLRLDHQGVTPDGFGGSGRFLRGRGDLSLRTRDRKLVEQPQGRRYFGAQLHHFSEDRDGQGGHQHGDRSGSRPQKGGRDDRDLESKLRRYPVVGSRLPSR